MFCRVFRPNKDSPRLRKLNCNIYGIFNDQESYYRNKTVLIVLQLHRIVFSCLSALSLRASTLHQVYGEWLVRGTSACRLLAICHLRAFSGQLPWLQHSPIHYNKLNIHILSVFVKEVGHEIGDRLVRYMSAQYYMSAMKATCINWRHQIHHKKSIFWSQFLFHKVSSQVYFYKLILHHTTFILLYLFSLNEQITDYTYYHSKRLNVSTILP